MTDTDALTERIARAAATSEGFGPDHPDHEIVVGEYLSDARFIAPFIAEEVRKAKAKALREAAGPEWGNDNTLWSGPRVRAKINRRATEYETGDGTSPHASRIRRLIGSPTRDCGRGPCCLGDGRDGDCKL